MPAEHTEARSSTAAQRQAWKQGAFLAAGDTQARSSDRKQGSKKLFGYGRHGSKELYGGGGRRGRKELYGGGRHESRKLYGRHGSKELYSGGGGRECNKQEGALRQA